MASVGRVIPADGLRVRKGPGTEHEILGALEMGEEVGLIDLVGEWWGATTRFGPGFVHGAFIEVIVSSDDGEELPELSYTCVQGDTLFSIGRRFEVPFEAIATLNGLVEPFTLQVGQVLRVPRAGGQGATVSGTGALSTTSLSILNPLVFGGRTLVTSSSLQGHHTPFLGTCSVDLDVIGMNSPGFPVRFDISGPPGVRLRGVVRERGLACRSRQVSDGGRTVKLAIQQRRDGSDWTDTGAWVLYAHLDPVVVQLGDVVSPRDAIGAMGPPGGGEYNSSCAQGSHVHVEAHRARCLVSQEAVIQADAVMVLEI